MAGSRLPAWQRSPSGLAIFYGGMVRTTGVLNM
jgi:hypothetical protein